MLQLKIGVVSITHIFNFSKTPLFISIINFQAL